MTKKPKSKSASAPLRASRPHRAVNDLYYPETALEYKAFYAPANSPSPSKRERAGERVSINSTTGWVCRGCGCTKNKPCPGGCWWVEENLCDRCLAWSDNFTPLEIIILEAALTNYKVILFPGAPDISAAHNSLLDRIGAAIKERHSRVRALNALHPKKKTKL